jgi:cobalt-zinc-cadmium efflux system membrane fusion protein
LDRSLLRVLVTVSTACTLAAATLLLNGCSSGADNAPPPNGANVRLTDAQRASIQLYTVEASSYRRSVATNGVVDFDNDQATSVLAPFSGPVSKLLVFPGEHVELGQPLAVVDSPDFAAAVSAYQKALATAQTNRRLADLDKDLLAHQGVSQREAAQAETDAVNAEADRDAALRALTALSVPAKTIAELQQGHAPGSFAAMIRSPVTGTVVEKLITPGELLQAGTTACFTVADLSRVWVMAQLFGANLDAVGVGDTAEVLTGIGAHTFTGKVDNIGALVNPDTRAVAVRVVVDNPQHFLRKQMYVHVVIQARHESSGTLIPVSTVLRDDENLPFVYALQTDGSFARRHVTLGARVGERYEIRDGLHVGEQIVVAGGLFVQFMQSQ